MLAASSEEKVVGLNGLEPSTSRLSGARSNQLSYEPILLGTLSFGFPRLFAILASAGFRGGGDDGIRTHDPLLAGQVLSQLSYTPIWCCGSSSLYNELPSLTEN